MDIKVERRINDLDRSIPGLEICLYKTPDPWELIVISNDNQDWRIFKPQEHSRSEIIVGTTIIYKKKAYRIFEGSGDSKGVWTYRMKAWPEYELWVEVVELTPEIVAEIRALTHERNKIKRLSHLSPFYEVWLGWLPSDMQHYLSLKFHFCAENASRKNALLELGLGLYFTFIAILYLDIKSQYLDMNLFMVALLLISEGLLRWLHIGASNNALGLIPLEFFSRGISIIYTPFSKATK